MNGRFLVVVALAVILCSPCSRAAPREERSRDVVDLPLFHQVAINELFKTKAPQVVSAYLFDSQNNGTFNVMVESQIYLYWKFAAQHIDNPTYLRNLAFYIDAIRGDPRFAALSLETEQRLEDVVADLPSSLRHFFFDPHFCLLNKNYSEFVYVTDGIDIDEKRRYVFMWREPNKVGPNGHWTRIIESQFQRESSYLDMKVAIKAKNMFIYRENEIERFKNMIVGWRSGEVRPSSFWTMELVDGKFLVFSQNGYILCASSDEYNKKRRYVYAYNDSRTKNSPECQWIAKDCPN